MLSILCSSKTFPTIIIIIDEELNIKVIDFGLSKMLESGDSLMMTFCGSEAYIAPEIV